MTFFGLVFGVGGAVVSSNMTKTIFKASIALTSTLLIISNLMMPFLSNILPYRGYTLGKQGL